ncbi:MAG: LTA synthase family protein [Vicinamibacteraceae bacterium]
MGVARGDDARSSRGVLRRWLRRARLARRLFAIELGLWTVLRLLLVAAFRDPSIGAGPIAGIIVIGAGIDAVVAATSLLPWLLIGSVLHRRRAGGRWRREAIVAVATFALVFDACVQYFFFEEYSSRYNHLALDYVIYPHEVLGNIFASYNVPLVVGLSAVAAVAIAVASRPRTPAIVEPWTVLDRLTGAGVTLALAVTLAIAWTAMPAGLLVNRTANELALNGWPELVRAYLTAHLDYEAYYAMDPPEDAARRVSRLIGQAPSQAGLVRHFPSTGRVAGGPLDVVIIMEESLGSAFSARFGGASGEDEGVTPELDRWSRQGIALTNVIATGNRTVRGLEGVLCSFPPLPGDAIVKRDRSENVASVARILAARGYRTTFLYGGYGVFDNLKPFMLANGYQAFVEEPAYPATAFRTIWGVADEFVFDELLARQKAANRSGQPWFGTALTVSNHKPFAVPAGRVAWPAGWSGRRGAVRYADWALGRYLDAAQREGLLAHTVVLIVGDHGARVYGAEEIPVASYRVPAVILTPDPAHAGTVIDRLASQVDLAPTLLSLAGVSYDAPFFGTDLLGLPGAGGRAFVNHNRSIGLVTDANMVVLGLHRSLAFYRRADRHGDVFTRTGPDASRGELAADAEALFQTAYTAYRDRTYRLPDEAPLRRRRQPSKTD